MTKFREPLDKGLWTSLDPALLPPGYLTRTRNCYYRRGSSALQRAKGREQYGFVSGSASAHEVVGLRDITFDNGSRYLVGLALVTGTGRLRYGPIGATGSFTDFGDVAGIPSAQGLEIAHYRNRFYAFTGARALSSSVVPSTQVLYLSATGSAETPKGRQHGMVPVSDKSTVTTAGGGQFSLNDTGATGYYEYWTTEVAKVPTDGEDLYIESTYVGDPATVFISATSVVPTIAAPPFKNNIPDAVRRWRVYRSPRKELEKDHEFPNGFMIAELRETQTTYADKLDVSSTSFAFPTIFNSSTQAYGTWDNASAMGADDGVNASAQTASFAIKTQAMSGFSLPGIIGAIRGIEVEVQAYGDSANLPLSVTIGIKNPDGSGLFKGQAKNPIGDGVLTLPGYTASKTQPVPSVASGAPSTLTYGGTNDRWFAPNETGLVDTDFTSSNLQIMLTHGYRGSSTTMNVDYVKAKVHYAGSFFDGTVQFPTVVYTFGDITSQVGKNGQPPSSSTGVIYQDSLVVNDVSNPSVIRYSFPGDPEAFPATYYLDFQTEQNDEVQIIKMVNNRLIVGLTGSLWRVKYLPSERDASFDRGQATEPISRSFGCIGPMLACVYSKDGSTENLAYVSRHGIHETDGYSFDTHTDLIRWRDIIPADGVSHPVALINDPEEQCLVFYYYNDTETYEKCLALRLHYGKEHVLEGGRLKLSGPVHMRNFDAASGHYAKLLSAWPVVTDEGDTKIYLGYGSSPTIAQWARPSTTESGSNSNWTDKDGGTTTIYTSIDDEEAATGTLDADYIKLLDDAFGSDSIYKTKLSTVTRPNVIPGYVLSFRGRKTGTITVGDYFTVTLRIGTGSDFFTRTTVLTTSGFTTFEWELTNDEVLAISDFANIVCTIKPTSSTSSGSLSWQVSWVQLEAPGIPNVAAGAGAVYLETGHDIPSRDPAMSYTTRRMFQAGFGEEWRLTRIYGYVSSHIGYPLITYTARASKTNAAGERAVASKETRLSGQFLHSVSLNNMGEGISLTMDTLADHNDQAHEFLVIEGEGWGGEDAGPDNP